MNRQKKDKYGLEGQIKMLRESLTQKDTDLSRQKQERQSQIEQQIKQRKEKEKSLQHEVDRLKIQLQVFSLIIGPFFFYTSLKDGTYFGMALSVGPSICPFTIACGRDILKTACQIDMTLIPLRPRTLLIWGFLRKPRWLSQQFEG